MEPTKPPKMKPSTWLEESTDSHAIQTAGLLAEHFEAKVGMPAVWPTHTVRETIKNIKARGLGGSARGEPTELVVYGYEVAESLAMHFIPGWGSPFEGRGRRFRQAIEDLRKAGF